MSYIFAYGLLLAAVFCSYNLAREKQQNHIVWPVVTVIFGPAIFIIQYLALTISDILRKRRAVN